jgi:DNA-binding transcriptional ArsR family regulator
MKPQDLKQMIQKCDEVSAILKSLSHPVRLKVLCQLMDQEKTAGELTDFCEISQSSMSQFLKRMRIEGVLKSRKEETRIYYSIADEQLKKLIYRLKEIYCQ